MASLYNLTRSILFLVAFIAIAPHVMADTEYTIYLQTGRIKNAGTNANVGIRLYNSAGERFDIGNLKDWGGAMGPGHDYFENGNLDVFKGTGPLRSHRVCRIDLVSDGRGNKPGWYVDYVAVASDSGYVRFDVYQWLAVDEPPYQLSTVRNKC